jgi:hypothetical protein
MVFLYMTKSISILLLSLTLMGSVVDFHNLAKMPRLIEHYKEHRKRLSNFSFMDFLALHYGRQAGQHDQDERGKHRTLPFKSSTCPFSHIMSFISNVNAFELNSTSYYVSYPNFYQSTFYSGFSESIWQPPRN